jgi:hypothetical protein
MTACTNCGEQIPEDGARVEDTKEGTMCLGCAGVCFYLEIDEDLNFEEENEIWECTLMDGLEDEEWKDD